MSPLSEKFLIKFMKRLLNSWLKWNTLVYCWWCHGCQAKNSSSASPGALQQWRGCSPSADPPSAPSPNLPYAQQWSPCHCWRCAPTGLVLHLNSHTFNSCKIQHVTVKKKALSIRRSIILATSYELKWPLQKTPKNLIQEKDISMSWNPDILIESFRPPNNNVAFCDFL